MGERKNQVLVSNVETKLLRSTWGAAGVFSTAFNGPKSFIEHMRLYGEDLYLHDRVMCEGCILVNEDEKFIAVGMWIDHFYDEYFSTDNSEVFYYRDQSESIGKSYWIDLWRTLYAMIDATWKGWKVFIAQPEQIAVDGYIASLEELEKLHCTSIFSEMIDKISIGHLFVIIKKGFVDFEGSFEILSNGEEFYLYRKQIDWQLKGRKAEKSFSKSLDIYREMCGELPELDKSHRIPSENDWAVQIESELSSKFGIIEDVFQQLRHRIVLTRQYNPLFQELRLST